MAVSVKELIRRQKWIDQSIRKLKAGAAVVAETEKGFIQQLGKNHLCLLLQLLRLLLMMMEAAVAAVA